VSVEDTQHPEPDEPDDDERDEPADPYIVRGMNVRAERPGFSAAGRRNVRAFAEAFFSSDGQAPPRERMDWFENDVDDFIGHAVTRSRVLFKACLFTATWIAPLLIGRAFTRLGSLSIAERIDALEAMERAPVVSLALFALKAVTSFVYYEHPDAAREIHWDQRCLGNEHVPKRRLDVIASSSAAQASEP
jgi:hypothetical protein